MPSDPKQRFVAQHNNIECLFSYGSGGTSVDVYVQTTHDGSTWRDIGHFGQLTTRTVRDIWRASPSDSVVDFDQQTAGPNSRRLAPSTFNPSLEDYPGALNSRLP